MVRILCLLCLLADDGIVPIHFQIILPSLLKTVANSEQIQNVWLSCIFLSTGLATPSF